MGSTFAVALVLAVASPGLPQAHPALATGGPIPGAYDFEHLTAGADIDGQDGWRVSSSNGGSTTVQIPDGSGRNTIVPGHDGSKAARQLVGGAGVASFATRRDDATWSITPISPTGITVVEWEMNRPHWGAGFALGTSPDGTSFATGYEVIARNSSAPRVRIVDRNGMVVARHDPHIATFARYQLIIDRGDETVSLLVRDLDPGSTAGWVAPATLQDVASGLDASATSSNPANWNAMRLRSDSFDPTSLFDDIAFRTVEPSTRSIDVGDTPLTTSSSGSVTLGGQHLTGRLTATVAGAGFSLDDGTTSRAGITAGTIAVRFSPTALGPGSGTLTLAGEDMVRPLEIALAGMGTAAPPPPSPPPAPTVHCDGVTPRVGVALTCTAQAHGAIGSDVLWRASYNPTFAEGVVRIGPDGTGELTLVAPPTAVGQEIAVELVAWTAPITVGRVEAADPAPIPTSVPAGEGPAGSLGPTDVGLVAVIAAGLGVVGAAFAIGRRRDAARRRSPASRG